MKCMMNRTVFAAATVILTAGVAYAVPAVGNVVMTQRAGSRIMDITYDLADEAAIVTLGIETNGVAIPDSAVTRLTGDVCKVVEEGSRSIVWNAGVDWPENLTSAAKAKVTAWSTNAPPQVMVIDLTGGALTNSYPVTYYVSVEALPYGGVTNTIYKSSYLVMRKILNGAFSMGDGKAPVPVTLTQDFYAGVFQVTQGQWFNVMGGDRPAKYIDVASRAFRPMEMVSYHDIRENPATNEPINPNWPQSNQVGSDSFMGQLRSKTGISGFDLPTEAQWEYACRAGTYTYYNDNLGTPGNIESNAQMNVLGRYSLNGGKVWNGTAWVNPEAGCDPSYGTAIVGSYFPNKWDLYDMHGNVWEWCLDWPGTLVAATNPKGAESDSKRELRGGSWDYNASFCRSVARDSRLPASRYYGYGFRLVRNLP